MEEEVDLAAFILPYKKIPLRTILWIVVEWEYELFLLERNGTITTAGGLRRKGEGSYDCARRELRDQLGMEATVMHASLAHVGGHLGHPLVGVCSTTEQIQVVGEPAEGCKRVRMSLEDAVRLAWRGVGIDDVFTVQVMALYTGLLAVGKTRPVLL